MDAAHRDKSRSGTSQSDGIASSDSGVRRSICTKKLLLRALHDTSSTMIRVFRSQDIVPVDLTSSFAVLVHVPDLLNEATENRIMSQGLVRYLMCHTALRTELPYDWGSLYRCVVTRPPSELRKGPPSTPNFSCMVAKVGVRRSPEADFDQHQPTQKK